MDFEALGKWMAEHDDEMVELQTELTARPALGPDNNGTGEWEKAQFLEQYLREHGLDRIEHYDCPDERVPEGSRPNLVVTIPGAKDVPRYQVLSHMDVVPPGEQLPDGSWKGWESDPYRVARAGDLIVGRGVTDDQQAIVSAVFAARALVENGITPAHTVRLLFVSDEETGSYYGLHYLLRVHEELFAPQDAIIVPDGGTADSTMIEVAEKSVLWMEFRVKGRQVHASEPDEGINAFRAASRLVCLLDNELNGRFDKLNHLYDPPCSTFEPTLHEANVPNVNTIPGEDMFCFDCRILPGYSPDDALRAAHAQCLYVDEQMGTETKISVRMRQDAPPVTPGDAPVVQALRPAIKKVYGVQPVTRGKGGITVAGALRAKGFPAAVWMTTTGDAHRVNESCSVKHMIGDARVFAEVFRTELPGA